MTTAETTRLDWPGTLMGFRRLLPLSVFVGFFGVAFGLASTQTGLSPLESTLMSITVFAGASQFAALELWGQQVSLVPLILTTFAINSRHILMGASLYPWLRELPAGRRYGILTLLTDANWAMAAQDYQSGRRNLGIILGGGLAIWSAWVAGTAIGAYFGAAFEEPERFGLDMVLGCFLFAMALGSRKTPRTLVTWGVAAVTALIAKVWLPPHTHVVAGAIAGGLVGAFWLEGEQA
ncbi:AzlC family ABC transporter permease [Marinobacteraceae bacterium S3BR75-40.1]